MNPHPPERNFETRNIIRYSLIPGLLFSPGQQEIIHKITVETILFLIYVIAFFILLKSIFLSLTKTLLYPLLFLCIRTFSRDAEISKPDSIKKEIIATKINSSLRIDGVLNEAEWMQATLNPRIQLIGFYQKFFGQIPELQHPVRLGISSDVMYPFYL